MRSTTSLFTVVCAAVLTCGSTFALDKSEYNAQKDRIGAEYKQASKTCDGQKGNAKDICIKEAKGQQKIARAELDAQRKPGIDANYKVAVARADANYDTAKEKCDDLKGNDKDVCVKDAKAARATAMADAKVTRAKGENRADAASKADMNAGSARGATTGALGNSSVIPPKSVQEVRKDTMEDVREAQYKAAKERCDALKGSAQDKCVADAKVRFGQ